MQILAQREMQVWDEVRCLIEKSQSKAYDQAVALLVKLKDLANFQNQTPAFQQRLNGIYEQYSNRSGLKRRLQAAGLSQNH